MDINGNKDIRGLGYDQKMLFLCFIFFLQPIHFGFMLAKKKYSFKMHNDSFQGDQNLIFHMDDFIR